MRKIFITGAEGFIGSHLTESLLKNNYKITALCRYNFASHIHNLGYVKKNNNLNIVFGDICDLPQMIRFSAGHDIIIHAAALIGIPYSYTAVNSYLDVNVKGTVNILEAARINNISHTVIMSTSEVYGTAQYTPMDENHPLIPSSPYAASKLAAESMASAYYTSFNTPITIVRPFNVYGPRQSMRAVIPTIINQALNGKTIKIGSTDTIRDFNYIDDTVSGIINIIETKNTAGSIFNLCSNKAYSISEIITVIEEIKGEKLNVIIDKKRIRPFKSEVSKLLGDNSKAIAELGFNSRINIFKGLKSTYNWYKKYNQQFADDYYI